MKWKEQKICYQLKAYSVNNFSFSLFDDKQYILHGEIKTLAYWYKIVFCLISTKTVSEATLSALPHTAQHLLKVNKKDMK